MDTVPLERLAQMALFMKVRAWAWLREGTSSILAICLQVIAILNSAVGCLTLVTATLRRMFDSSSSGRLSSPGPADVFREPLRWGGILE